MSKAVVTGINGFVGSYLAESLLEKGVEVFGTVRPGSDLVFLENIKKDLKLEECELLNREAVKSFIGKIKPDQVYHLAALVQSHSVPPRDVYENNIFGQLNILEALREQEIKARVLLIGTAHEYGSTKEGDSPIREDRPLNPNRSYGASKAAQSLMGFQFFKEFGMEIIRTRSFNHAGARRNEAFVEGAFAKQIAEIEAELKEPLMMVGNLESKADFSHVKDVVEAYILLIEKGVSGEVYNVGSGVPHTIKELLDTLLSFSTVKVEVKPDPNRYRPTEVFYADVNKLKSLGWKPQFSFENMLKETLEWWRKKIKTK